jgi:TRAP-type C4-dicarboxylate transport system substrate-binding protein
MDYVCVEHFADWAREASGGRLDITVYPEAAVVPTEDTLTAISTGVVEAASSCGSYYASVIPEGELEAGLPMTWRDGMDMSILFYGLGWQDIIREAYAEQGVHYLSVQWGGSVGFWTKDPFQNMADLQGVKMRHFGRYAEMLTEMGVAATYLPHAEVYSALATGVLEGSGTVSFYFSDMKYYEQCKYFAQPALGYGASQNLIVNMDAWNKLPDDLKEIAALAGELSCYDYDRLAGQVEREMIGHFPEWGVNIVNLPDSDLKDMGSIAVGYLDNEATKSARSATMVQILKDFLKMRGYI